VSVFCELAAWSPQATTRAYRYTKLQAVRAGLVTDSHDLPHTRVDVECDAMIRRPLQLKCFLEDVPYARYERKQKGPGHRR